MRSTGSTGATRRRSARLGVRSMVLLVVLVPTLAMAATLGASVAVAWSDRAAARDLQGEVDALVAIVDARAAVSDEELASSVIAAAAAYGVDPSRLEELYGLDHEAELSASRAAVDADPVLAGTAELGDGMGALAALRSEVDRGTADLDDVNAAIVRLKGEIDALWDDRAGGLDGSAGGDPLASASQIQLDALDDAYRLLQAGNVRAEVAREVLTDDVEPAQVARLVAADAAFGSLGDALGSRLGPRGRVAWEAFLDDADAQRFEQTIEEATEVGLRGSSPPLRGDGVAFGEAFSGGAHWAQHLADLVRATGEDLRAQAEADAAAATRTVVLRSVAALALTSLSLAAAAVLARTVVRPVQRLGEAARQVRDGRFEPDRLEPRGPRELADAADAFNEMSATLAAVEDQAVLLAEDPGAEVPPSLPGRVGAALHVAFERLRSSILLGEQQRAELHALASHDPLTGLLNRAALLDALDRALADQARRGQQTMVLFVDLDGLKQINDVHGHAAGDAALQRVADALRSTTRAADAVARYGGDEFVVVGAVGDGAEAEALAERIRRRVADEALDGIDEPMALSTSIGIAVGPSGGASGEDLLREADGALYQAKRAGRNRWQRADAGRAR